MSQFWKEGEELGKAVIGAFEKLLSEEEIMRKVAGLNWLIVWHYHDPDVQIWAKIAQREYGIGPEPGKADVQIDMSGDDAHRSWSNKLNWPMAIARKKVQIKGNVAGVLKLVPLLKRFTIAYNQTLKEMGKDDIILE
jgi:hypothetical protein